MTFLESYKENIHRGTVTRGIIREKLFTPPEALAAAKAGRPFPNSTVITMEDYRIRERGRIALCILSPIPGVERLRLHGPADA